MATPKAVGNRSEGAVNANLIKLGYSIAIPFGENLPYDVIVDVNGRLLKGQTKTGHLRRNCVQALLTSNRGSKWAHGYEGLVDLFFIYFPPLDKVYCVPASEVKSAKQISLRLAPYSPCGGNRGRSWSQAQLAEMYELKPPKDL